ncbi:putative ATPase [Leishmania infantum JPCM5]|uniref:ATPase_-_putative n=2 Tax=Leishmania infantum TaxID=5671 RepID=A0A6L0XGH1_LEIIN|nr:putative ATPase [Leishmania infantum JPCM5]CAC9498713.1 ATPase_-_putative [Leishmania infantum]CAM69017.1 putative ATPase [Leishmania infantum JPCM5]SUZ42908.1 ATPase_-_putative [Leishmania infantum]|eukprot:XP_001466306.1 putative ATPase [Leishmania infantum JPCM5]
MIRVPGNWTCAQSPCAFVEVRDECYLCRLVPVFTATLTYELETSVRVNLLEARRFASQDFALAETHQVVYASCSSGIEYRPCAPGDRSREAMVIRCPVFHYTAKEVTVDGPRRAACATAAHIAAALMGRYVVVGAQFRTLDGFYTVRQVTLQKGYRGIALVSGDCRVRVNDARRAGSSSLGGRGAARPIGLESETDQLLQLLACADKSVGAIVGVMARGPRGCGVSSTVRYALESVAATHTVLGWSSCFSPSEAFQEGWGGTVVLVVTDAEHVFAAAEPEVAKLHLRKLQRDAAVLRGGGNGAARSVVVLCVSHGYGLCAPDVLDELVAFHLVFYFPGALQRAVLLASVRGGSAMDWLSAAQGLVGRTCAETLEAARRPDIASVLPFKAVRWSEIGGLAEVKDRLHRALVWPQQQPERMQRFHITPPRGILLYGPPGCAKTTLIKALCSEGNFSLIYLDSATVLSAYVGESERYLRDVFTRARRQAPCIVFFDEVEVLGGRRVSGGHDSEHVRLLSTLLTEMDGFADIHGVCFVGATNVPHLLDPALMRPGRFDYMVHVPLPTLADRESILQLLLCRTAADTRIIAEQTEGFSGADLKVFCSEALLALFKESAGVPQVLQERASVTAYLLQKASGFKRTHYDSTALDQFQREHASA